MKIENTLSNLYLESHPDDAARALEGLPLEQAAALLETAPAAAASKALDRMEPARSVELLKLFSTARVGEILEILPPESAVQLMLRLEPEERELLLGSASEATADRLRRLLTYPEDSAGRLMDPRVMAFPEDLEVAEAVRRLRRHNHQLRYYLYVTDPEHRLIGVLSLRELMAAPPDERLAPRFRRPVTRLSVRDTRSTVLQHPGWLKYHALPVTGGSGILVGVLRYKTLRKLEGETATTRPSDLIGLGSALGEAWVGISGLLFDGFAGSLHGSREFRAGKGGETNHGA